MKLNNPVLKCAQRLMLLTFISAFAQTAFAKDYKVEMVIFEHTNPGTITESSNYQPPRAPSSDASTWSIPITMLDDEAEKLKKSGDYQIYKHYAWGQQSLPFSRAAIYSLAEPQLQGFVKVYADQLLFANIDLEFQGYRMNEKRRLKLNERHYFDHPRFGILMQVSRLEKPKEEKAEKANDNQ